MFVHGFPAHEVRERFYRCQYCKSELRQRTKHASEAGGASQCVTAICLPLCAAVWDFVNEVECTPASDGKSRREQFVGICPERKILWDTDENAAIIQSKK